MSTVSPQTHTDRSTWQSVLELATREVFELMVNSPIDSSKPEPGYVPDFTAMVGLAGQICGVLSVRCSVGTASLMASRMLEIPIEEVDQERWDAAAEVCNMIAGNFKSKLSGAGSHCLLSVPTIVTGADYKVKSMADGETVQAWMLFEGNPLWIVLELHS